MRKKLQRNCKMSLKSVLNDAVGMRHTDLHWSCTFLVPPGPCDIPFTQEDVQKTDDNMHVPLCTLMGTEYSTQITQIRTMLPIFRGAEMQRCQVEALCANSAGQTPGL